MENIEVEWKASPASGITEIPLDELGVKSEAAWSLLSKEKQKQRINAWLRDNEEEIVAKAIEW